MTKQLKIAIYSGTIPSTTFIENIIEALANKNIRVFLFGKQLRQVKYKNKKGINIYSIPKGKVSRLVLTLFRSFVLLVSYPNRFITVYREVSKCKNGYLKWNWWTRYVPVTLYLPDVFHIQWAKDVKHWMFLKEEFQCKLVVSLLGSHINYSPIVDLELAKSYKDSFTRIDAFQAVSKAISKEAQKYNAPSDKIELIYTLIKPSLLKQYNNNYEGVSSQLKILSVGRHHWVKGYTYAIDAMRLLKEKDIDVEYSILAQGQIPEKLLFQVNQMKLKNEVSFLERLPQNELFQKMKNYDVLLLPSLNEGIANVVLEAMAIGLPVISSDCGGMNEVVIPNKTGFLVPIRDAEAIANTIIRIKQLDLKSLSEIRNNAHELIRNQFNYDESVEAFIKLYKNVIGENLVKKSTSLS